MAFQTPAYKVEVNGQDVTSRFAPFVTDIEVVDRDGLSSDMASIHLADAEGAIALPKAGARVVVSLGHAGTGIGQVFAGFVDEVRASFSKPAGRTIRITARGVDTRGKAKQAQGRHRDDATFGEVAAEFAAAAGLNGAKVSDELGSIRRPYWAMQNESFIAWGQRIARQIGATFKIQDNVAVFVDVNGGTSAGGSELPTITATFGQNLISGDIAVVVGRPRHKTVRVRYYDRKEGRWKEKEAEVEDADEDIEVDHVATFTAADDEQAEQQAKASARRVERNGGEGMVNILGDPTARPEAQCIVTGVRPGVDGTYRIEGVTHRVSKAAGYVTTLDLKQPQGEAGQDDRRATAAA